MRFQETTYSCGAAAVLNAARCFGKRIPERVARAVAGTTKEGTDEYDIDGALDALGFKGVLFQTDNFDRAVKWMAESYPAIVCVDNDSHWVVVIGQVDQRFIVIDSIRTRENMRENGVRIMSARELKRVWKKDERFFGVAVRRKDG